MVSWNYLWYKSTFIFNVFIKEKNILLDTYGLNPFFISGAYLIDT